METPRAVVPIAQVRERVIQKLTDAFANDLITIEELETRLEQVYRAQSAADAEALLDGVVAASAASSESKGVANRVVAGEAVPVHERFLSIFSSTQRGSLWSVPHQFDVRAVFAETVIDLTRARLPGDIVDMNVKAVFATVKIVIPPGLRVVNRVGAVLASVSSDPALDLAPMRPGSPVIRITGLAVFSTVEIVSGSTGYESG